MSTDLYFSKIYLVISNLYNITKFNNMNWYDMTSISLVYE